MRLFQTVIALTLCFYVFSSTRSLAQQVVFEQEVSASVSGSASGSFKTPITIGAGTSLTLSFTDISMIGSLSVDGMGFSETWTSDSGDLSSGPHEFLLAPGDHTMVETYSGRAVAPSLLIDIPDVELSETTFTHTFTVPGLHSNQLITVSVEVDTELRDLSAEVSGPFEGSVSIDGVLGDAFSITITSTRTIRAGESVEFDASFSASIVSKIRITAFTDFPMVTGVDIEVDGGGPALISSTLNASADGVDAQGSPLPASAFSFEWLKNGSPIPNETDITLQNPAEGDQIFAKGDEIAARATATDDGKQSGPVESAALTVENSSPGVPTSVDITPTAPTTLDVLTVNFALGDDDDSNSVEADIKWFFDAVEQFNFKNAQNIGPGILKGVEVAVEVRSRDSDGAMSASVGASVTVGNVAPVIEPIDTVTASEGEQFTVPIPVTEPDENDVVTVAVTATLTGGTAADPEPILANLTVDANLNLTGTPTNIPPAGVTFTITLLANDGTVDSEPREFNLAAQDANMKPIVTLDPSTILLTVPDQGDVTETVEVSAIDPDDDPVNLTALSTDPAVQDAVAAFNTAGDLNPKTLTLTFNLGDLERDANGDPIGRRIDINIFADDGKPGGVTQEELAVVLQVGDAPVNLPPTLSIPNQTLQKHNNPALDFFSIDFNQPGFVDDPDAPLGGELTFEVLSALPGAMLAEDGAFTWDYSGVADGVYLLTVKVTDTPPAGADPESDTQTVTFTIQENLNEKPQLTVSVPAEPVEEGEFVEIILTATDADRTPVNFDADGLPFWLSFGEFVGPTGSAPEQSTQSVAGIPPFDLANLSQETVLIPITFTATDAQGAVDSTTVTVTIQNRNRLPVFNHIPSQTVKEGQILQFTLSATDADADGLTFRQIADLNLEAGRETLVGNIYTLDLSDKFNLVNADETRTVTFQVTDDPDGDFRGNDPTLEVAIDIINVPRLPVIQPIGDRTVLANRASEIKVIATFADGTVLPDGTALSVTSTPDAAFLPNSIPGVAGEFILSLSPTFADLGEYEVTIAVLTADGGDSTSFTLFVEPFVEGQLHVIVSGGGNSLEPVEFLIIPPNADDTVALIIEDIAADLAPNADDSYSFRALFPPGTHNYTVTATSAQGALAEEVGDFDVANTPPEVTASEFTGTVVVRETTVSIHLAFTDIDDQSLTVSIFRDDDLIHRDDSALANNVKTVEWIPGDDVPTGIHTLEIQVDDGVDTTSMQTSISVFNPSSVPPPALDPLPTYVQPIVTVEGTKDTSFPFGVELLVNSQLVAQHPADADSRFSFAGVELIDNENRIQARLTGLFPFTANAPVLDTRAPRTDDNGDPLVDFFGRTHFTYTFNFDFLADDVDFTGNLSPEVVVFVDDTPPFIQIISPGAEVATQTPIFQASIQDANLDVPSITFRVDGVEKAATFDTNTGIAQFVTSAAALLAPGIHHFTVSADDLAGNEGMAEHDFTIDLGASDTSPPVFTSPSPADGAVIHTLITEVSINVSDAQSPLDPSSIVARVNGANVDAIFLASDAQTGQIIFTAEVFTDVTVNLETRIMDKANSPNEGVFNWSFTVDRSGPVVILDELPLCVDTHAVIITGAIAEPEPGVRVKLFRNGDEIAEAMADENSGGFIFLSVALSLGVNRFTAIATDSDGTPGASSNVIETIRDRQAPFISIITPARNQKIPAVRVPIVANRLLIAADDDRGNDNEQQEEEKKEEEKRREEQKKEDEKQREKEKKEEEKRREEQNDKEQGNENGNGSGRNEDFLVEVLPVRVSATVVDNCVVDRIQIILNGIGTVGDLPAVDINMTTDYDPRTGLLSVLLRDIDFEALLPEPESRDRGSLPFTLKVRAFDALGNWTQDSVRLSIEVDKSMGDEHPFKDRQPPAIGNVRISDQLVLEGEKVMGNDRQPTISAAIFDTQSGLASAEIEIEKVSVIATHSSSGIALPPVEVALSGAPRAPLADDTYRVKISARDGDNNRSREFTFDYELHTLTPEIQIKLSHVIALDDGTFVTNQPSVLTHVDFGRTDVPFEATWFVNGVMVAGRDYPKGHGGRVSMRINLAPGVNTITVKVADRIGNESSAEVVVRRDSTPTRIALVAIEHNGVLSPINGTVVRGVDDNNPTSIPVFLQFSDPSGIDEDSIRVRVFSPEVGQFGRRTAFVTAQLGSVVTLDGNPVEHIFDTSTGLLDFVIDVPQEGVYQLTAKGEDAAGNPRRSTFSASFKVDSTPPTVTIIVPAQDDEVINNPFAQLSGEIRPRHDVDTGSISTALTQTQTLDGTPVDNGVIEVSHFYNPSSGQVVIILPSDLPDGLSDGDYILEIAAADLVGNSGATERRFTLNRNASDKIKPAISGLTPQPGATVNSTNLATLSFIAADANGIKLPIVLIINGHPFLIDDSSSAFRLDRGRVTVLLNRLVAQQSDAPFQLDSSELSTSTQSPIGAGRNTVSLQVSDPSNNVSSVEWSFDVALTPPGAPTLDELASATDQDTISVSGATPDGASGATVTVFVNNVGLRTLAVDENGRFSANDVALVKGVNTIYSVATDIAGNQSRASAPQTIIRDVEPPEVTINELPATTDVASLVISGTVADDVDALTSLSIIVNDALAARLPPEVGDFSAEVKLQSKENTIRIEAVDAVGNTASATDTVVLEVHLLTTAPTALTAGIDPTGSGIRLTWQADANATTYNVYRSDTSIVNVLKLQPIGRRVAATTFTDTSVADGSTFYYSTTSVDAAGNEGIVASNSPNVALITGAGGTAAISDGTHVAFDREILSRPASVSINAVSEDSVADLSSAIDGSVRSIQVIGASGSAVETFDKAATLTLAYPRDAITAGTTPRIFVLRDDSWFPLANQVVDVTGNTVSASITGPGIYRIGTSKLNPWDVNDDLTVDIFDLVFVGRWFGLADVAADVNGDGKVNVFDLALIAAHFGESYAGTGVAPPLVNQQRAEAAVHMHMRAQVTQESDQVTLQVSADTSMKLGGVQFNLRFDPDRLSTIAAAAGGLMAENYLLPLRVDEHLVRPAINGSKNRHSSRVTLAVAAISEADVSASHAPTDDVLMEITFRVTGNPVKAMASIRLEDVRIADADGGTLIADWPNAVDVNALMQRTFDNALMQNYPNPFNPETWIPYSIAEDAQVRLEIYNVLGRSVRTIDLGLVAAGEYATQERAIYWDGRNNQGEHVASSVYFYVLHAGDFTTARKLVILK